MRRGGEKEGSICGTWRGSKEDGSHSMHVGEEEEVYGPRGGNRGGSFDAPRGGTGGDHSMHLEGE